MIGLPGDPVFEVAGERYDWADVVLGADLRAEWARVVEEARFGLACQQRADDEEDGQSASPPDQVEAAADEFRYARDLLTAEEMEAWLSAWHLDLEAWTGYVERSVLRQKWADQAAATVARHPVAPEDIEAVAWVEGVCSGRVPGFARDLAGRAAVYAGMDSNAVGSGAFADEARRLQESWTPSPAWSDLGQASLRARLDRLARLEIGLQRFSREALTAPAVRDEISLHRLDWIRLLCRIVTFPEEPMAREALLAIREDGADMTTVAAEAKTTLRTSRLYLEEAPAALKAALMSAASGELIGPVALDSEFALVEVVEKTLPQDTDPELSTRAERALMTALLAQEIDRRVTWRAKI